MSNDCLKKNSNNTLIYMRTKSRSHVGNLRAFSKFVALNILESSCRIEFQILIYQPLWVAATRLILRVFLSWSRIFFSISASVRVSKNGDQESDSPWFRNADSISGKWFSLKAYVFLCQANYWKKEETLNLQIKKNPVYRNIKLF